MLERSDRILKILCLGLAALFVLQCARLVARKDPLANLAIGHTPALAAAPAPPAGSKATNAAPGKTSAPRRPAAPKPPELPPAIQARVDRVTQSEILGPVVRPLPMALLGIAGDNAFLRAPNGQTGLLRAGEELGGVKLLRIGTNRVLIEHEQQQKELTVFSGFGSETLLPKGKATPQ